MGPDAPSWSPARRVLVYVWVALMLQSGDDGMAGERVTAISKWSVDVQTTLLLGSVGETRLTNARPVLRHPTHDLLCWPQPREEDTSVLWAHEADH